MATRLQAGGVVNTVRHRCPVCWRPVTRTVHGLIEGHWDSLGVEPCPAIGEPYRITLASGRGIRRAALQKAA